MDPGIDRSTFRAHLSFIGATRLASEERRETIETLVPELVMFTDPCLGVRQRGWIETDEMVPARNAPPNEARPLKHRHVLRDCI